MSYTPGPWKTIFKPILTETQSPRAWRMFVTSEMGAVGASNGETVEEATANARLIAVAPDLLEALEAVVRVADRATVEFDQARAAIAKARGAA